MKSLKLMINPKSVRSSGFHNCRTEQLTCPTMPKKKKGPAVPAEEDPEVVQKRNHEKENKQKTLERDQLR
jgi:hypothetical protein